MSNAMSARTAANSAAAKVLVANAAFREAEDEAAKAKVALESAIAALQVKEGDEGPALSRKIEDLKKINERVKELKTSMDEIQKFADGAKFIEGPFGFVPIRNNISAPRNNSEEMTLNKQVITTTLSTLKSLTETLNNNNIKIKNNMNGTSREKSPSRNKVIEALMAGITKFSENMQENHMTSLANAAAKAEAARAAAGAAEAQTARAAAAAAEAAQGACLLRKNRSKS